MPPTTDIRPTIQSSLAEFQTLSIDKAALSLLDNLATVLKEPPLLIPQTNSALNLIRKAV